MRSLASITIAVATWIAIIAYGQDAKEVQRLEKTLANDRHPHERAEAAWQLGQIGATDAVPALVNALQNDSSTAVRANAAASLWHLGEASRPAIPALTKALDDSSGAVVGNAAGALIKLGTPKSKMVPVYRGLLTHPDCEDRVIALEALATEVPATELFDAAWICSGPDSSENSDVQRDAEEALRKIVGRKDRALAPRLLSTVQHLGTRAGSDLISAIGGYDPPIKEAAPILESLLDYHDESNSSAAARALGDMKIAALPALPGLVTCMQSHAQNKTREECAKAIGEIGPKASSAVVSLVKAGQSDKWPSVRKAAVGALGEMGPAAKEAIPMLREQLKSPDDWMRLEARNALFRVEPGKNQEVADIADAHKFEEEGILWEDLSGLSSAVPARFSEVYELIIYDKYAMFKVPQSDSPSGWGRYTYKAGAITGPEEESSSDCKKKVALSKVDFSVVPNIAKQAPGLLGSSEKVTLVELTPGVFCRSHGWMVVVGNAGFVEFNLAGKPGKVQKL